MACATSLRQLENPSIMLRYQAGASGKSLSIRLYRTVFARHAARNLGSRLIIS